MYSKQIIEKLALSSQSLDSIQQGVETGVAEVRSDSLKTHVPVSVVVTGGQPGALFIHLDGGAGDRNTLLERQTLLAMLAQTGVIPRHSIHVSFSGGANVFYTGGWETWVTDELPQWVASEYSGNVDRENRVLTGISAGGHGALKIAFKHPHAFRAVAAMEPVIMPALDWPQQHTRAAWWMLDASARAVWGEPFPQSFLSQHPPNIAAANTQQILASGLEIYLEAGDEDLLHLQDGAEFLHRLLWQFDIPHEYHQVRWADHGGYSIDDRLIEALAFLSAALAGGNKQSRNLELTEAEQQFVDYVLSGGPIRGEPVPAGASQGSAETELTVMARLWQPLKKLAEANDPDMQRQYGRLPDIGDQG